MAKAIFDARPQAMDVDPSFSGEMVTNIIKIKLEKLKSKGLIFLRLQI